MGSLYFIILKYALLKFTKFYYLLTWWLTAPLSAPFLTSQLELRCRATVNLKASFLARPPVISLEVGSSFVSGKLTMSADLRENERMIFFIIPK